LLSSSTRSPSASTPFPCSPMVLSSVSCQTPTTANCWASYSYGPYLLASWFSG
jgi:hypothetical protein